MSVKLLPPGKGTGKRKHYKHYYIIGSLDGKKVEESTKQVDYKLAKRALDKYNDFHAKSKQVSEYVSLKEAAERLKDDRPHLSEEDKKRIDRLAAVFPDRPIMDIVKDDANRFIKIAYPNGAEASTLNRYVITPLSMILNYAASNKWREPIKLKRFKEKKPKPRYMLDKDHGILLKFLGKKYGKDSEEYLIFLWLSYQGDRISDSLKAKYEDFDLDKEIFSRHISKSDTYDDVPLDSEIVKILKKDVKDGKEGKVFRWDTRWGVYKWLGKACKEAGVTFTPHMARHTLGKRLNDSGAGLKTIMQVLGQSDPRSAVRYQTTGISEMREAKNRSKVGKKEGKKKKC